MLEKNINSHNYDVELTGHYIYTDKSIYSAVVSTATIQEHLEEIINKFFPRPITILDVGAGDGTFTADLKKRIKPKKIIGIEPAVKAVSYAKKHFTGKNISFRIGNIYSSVFKKNQFDLILLRSILHHLYYPKRGLKNILKYGHFVLIVEPNGYSPALKIIEKISPYHLRHEEKSYFPHEVRSWLKNSGFELLEERYINLVPTFAPKIMVKILKILEPFVEAIPILKHLLCAQNITLYKKTKR